jgi:hypothetical protein
MSALSSKNAGRIGAVIYLATLFLLLFFLKLHAERMEPDPGSLEMELGFASDGFGPYTPPTNQSSGGGSPTETQVIASDAPSEVQVNANPTPSNQVRNPSQVNNPNPQPNQPNQRNEFDDMWSESTSSSGRTEGDNKAGNPDGRPNAGGGGGGRGYSTGNAFGNGDATFLPKPDVRSGEDGIVVLQLCVDRNGRVSSIVSDRAKGSTATDPLLYSEARRSAMRATFPSDPNAPDCRVAFIRYNFIKGFGN